MNDISEQLTILKEIISMPFMQYFFMFLVFFLLLAILFLMTEALRYVYDGTGFFKIINENNKKDKDE